MGAQERRPEAEATIEDDPGTIPESPAALRASATSSSPSFHSPTDVLYENELMRGRMWVVISGGLGLAGVLSALLFRAPGADARMLLAAGSGGIFVSSLIGWAVLRRDDRYSTRLAALYGYACLLATLPAFHFFGWFSPVTILVALGAVIFAMGHTHRAVIAMCVAAVTAHTTLALLTIRGVVSDRGVAALRVNGTTAAYLSVVACEGLFIIAFIIGRRLRAHSLIGIERYGEVVRENTRRETLLQEAAEELRRARNVGGPGRYSGLQLGSFRLGAVLGRGGMGEVYDATHASSGQPAAVKVITPTGDDAERKLRRFEREIDLVATVQSPHVVRVLGHSLPGDSVMYLAMEKLRGASLAEELRSLERPSIYYILDMLRQVAGGVGDAHAAGVIHRDLTAHNLFHHTGDGADVWKVLDFGVSAFLGHDSSLTGGGVVGTPSYMSPEQASSSAIDQRSDLFSLGCIAYRCLTGQAAFRGDSVAQTLYRVVHQMPEQPSSLAALPREVNLVLAIAMAKNRSDRFASADDLVQALVDACDGAISPDVERRASALLAVTPWRRPS